MYSNFMHTLLTVVLDDRKACRSLRELATTNACKVNTSKGNHIKRLK